MLGKHNFKERLRKMEKQDKHDRFSIRKLTIGAASVLIGFAFMGLNVSSVQASSNPLDQIKEEEEQNNNKKDNNSDQNDQGKIQVQLGQNEKPQLAGQNNDQANAADQTAKNDKQAASDQSQESQPAKAKKEVKPDVTQSSNDQAKAGSNEVKSNDQAQSSVYKSNSAAGNKTNNQTAQPAASNSAAKQSAQKQNNNQADNAQGKAETAKAGQSNVAGQANDKANNQAQGQQKLKSADLLKGNNNLAVGKKSSSDKNTVSSIDKLQDEIKRANDLEKTNYFKTIDQAKQNQLKDLVKQANQMMQNYQTQMLGISLLELPEEQNKNKKNGAKSGSGTQSFDIGKLNGVSGNLGSLLSSLVYMPGQATQNVSTFDDFKNALLDTHTRVINLENDITITSNIVDDSNNALSDEDRTINGNGHKLTFLATIKPDHTSSNNLTFNNIHIVISTSNPGIMPSNDVPSNGGKIIFKDSDIKVTNGSVIGGSWNGTDIEFQGNNTISGLASTPAFKFTNLTVDAGATLTGTGYLGQAASNDGQLYFKGTVNYSNPSGQIFTGIQHLRTFAGANASLTSGTGTVLTIGDENQGNGGNLQIDSGSKLLLKASGNIVNMRDSSMFSSANISGSLELDGDKLPDFSEAHIKSGGTFIAKVNSITVTSLDSNNAKYVDFESTTPLRINSSGDNGNYFKGDAGAIYYHQVDQNPKSWEVSSYNMDLSDGFGSGNQLTGTAGEYGSTPITKIVDHGYANKSYILSDPSEFVNAKPTQQYFYRLAFGSDLDALLVKTDAGRYNATNNGKVVKIHSDQSTNIQTLDPNNYLTVTDSENNNAQFYPDNVKWIAGTVRDSSGNVIGSIDSTGKFTFNEPAPTISTTSLPTSDITSGTHSINDYPRILITYADGTTDTVPVEVDVVSAEAKTNSEASPLSPTNNNFVNPSSTDAPVEAENLISNTTDLSQWSPTYSFVDDSGNALTEFGRGTDITGDSDHKVVKTNVKVSYSDGGYQIVKNIWLKVKKSQADTFNNLGVHGNITAHVVNTGNVADYQNGLINTGTTVSYTDASDNPTTGTLSSLGVTGITWATSEAPAVSAATSSPETATATVTFGDNSTATINFDVTVVGASASSPNQSVLSGSQPTVGQANAAINNADATTGVISGWPAGSNITANVDNWVKATETGGEYSDITPVTPSNRYNTTWSSATGAANTVSAYVEVNYGDGTSQIVPVTLDINSLASSVDPNKSDVKGFNVHANATSADPTSHLTLKNTNGDTLTGWTFDGWATRTGNPGAYNYSDVNADDLKNDFSASNLTNGTNTVTLYAKVKMTADQSTAYVSKAFTLTVVGAVANSSATTDHGTPLTASDQLQNYSTLSSDFGSDITSVDWTDADGNAVDATTYWNDNTDNDTATNPKTSVTINGSEDAYITVKYSDGTKQTVWIPLKIKSDLDNNGSNITLSANSKDVHYGQALSDADARGLLKNNNNPIAAGDVSATDTTKEFKSIQWVNDSGSAAIPETTPSTINTTGANAGENDVTAHIKITFQDNSYITKDVTVKVHSGYNNSAQSLTINSGDKPSADEAKTAIANNTDLSNNYNATGFAWAKDSSGTVMDRTYVTDGRNNDTKPAWVVITYSDGAKQIVKVNDLTIHNMANALTVDHVTGGFNYHAVSSGSPYNSPDPSISSDALKGYFTVKDGTADASSDVSSAAWTTGHTVDWTSTTAQTPQVTLTFTDGSSKSYELPTQLVKANVTDTTYTVNRNDVPDSNDAKGKVSNASALSTYNPTYGWYSDPAGTTALAATDVAAPTPAGSPKTVYLKVDYHKGSATGTADGYEIIPIQLTVQNSSANYRAGLRAGVSGLTLHVGQPNSDFEGSGFFGNNISNLITITKRSDGSVVSPTDTSIINSITWGNNSAGRSTEPSTAANAPSSQMAQIVIIFQDAPLSDPDTITVNVPVTVLKATAKSDISTNHGHALTASDEISNLTDLNNSNLNFSAPAADVTWATDSTGTALPTGFWDASTDGSTATDPANSSHQVSDAKGIYLIVHYKKGTGAAATDDGTQAIWVPVKIKSDRDNEAANYSVDTNNENIHYGQSVDPVGLIRHKNTDGTYSDLTDNDIGSGHAITNITWVTTPNTSVVSDNSATPDVQDVTGQIQITFSDTSTLATPLTATLHVHSGYNNTAHTENVVSGTVPSAADAKAAIANATDLINHYHVTGFAWAQDADGTAMTAAYITSATDVDNRPAWVKITYTDGTGASATRVTQVVKVNDLKITSEASHYHPVPTVNDEGQANGITTHVNAPAIHMNTLPIRFKYTDAAGNTNYETLSHIIAAGGSVAWNTNSAGTEIKPDLTKDSNGAHNFPVIITYADGSTSAPVQVSVNVIGAKAKGSASTNHDHALTASDEIDNLNTLEDDFHVASGDVSWTDASGNPIDASTYWHNNTDGDHATNPTTNHRINGSKDAYITVKYGDGTHQTVWIPLQIKSDADNIDPETGIQFAGNVRAVTVHADSHSANLTNRNITIIETTTGRHIPYNTATGSTPNGWVFSGWATRNSSGYHDITSTGLINALNDSDLDGNGKKDVTDRYAVINLPDGSTLYTPAMTIHVLGAVGQSVTFNHADAIPDPTTDKGLNNKTAIKNATALGNQFGTVTYTWMKNTGTAASPTWTNMTADDFNHREVNEPVIVRVKYGNDINTQDVHLNLTIHDDSDEIDPTNTTAASNGDYNTHIGAKINGSTNFGNVDLKNAISFRDANNHPLFLDNTGAPTWHFAGFVDSATGTTPTDVDMNTADLTNGVHDLTNLYAYIKLHDGSYTHVKMNHVKVYGGYEAKTTTGSGASAVTTYPTTAAQDPTTGANKDLTPEQAQAAIANSSTLNSLFSPTGAAALTYAWSTDGTHTGAGYKPDVNYNETTDNTKVRTADVIITYGDGTKQVVQVHYNVKSMADRIDPDNTNAASSGDYNTHIGANINGSANFGNVDLKNAIHFRDADNHPMFIGSDGNPTWHFAGFVDSATGTTPTDVDMNTADLTNGVHDLTNLYAYIKLPDGSYAHVKMNHVKVYGGYEAKTTTGSGASAVTTYPTTAAQDPATGANKALTDEQAQAAIANSSTLNDLFSPTGAAALTYAWSTDGTHTGAGYKPDVNYNETSDNSKVRTAYVIITYGDGTTQKVQVHYNVHSLADSVGNITVANDNSITVHADSHTADPTSAITIKDNNGNTIDHDSTTEGWTVLGWATRTGSGASASYQDVASADLISALSHSNLDNHGKHDVTGYYAKIKMHDGSILYTPAMTIHVLGALGQDVTFNHADAIPAADTATDLNNKTAITNATALSDQFGTVTYTWMKNTGSAASPVWTNMTADDFNTHEDNEPVIVRVKYGTDTNTQDVHLNLTIHDDSEEIDPTNTNAASNGDYNTHIGANINGSANFGSVDLKNAISFRDSNNHALFLDSAGAPLWHFAGFVDSATGTTPTDVDMNTADLTNGVHDLTNLYAYIELPDGSYTHVKMNHVKVYGGYEAKTTTGSGASAVTTYPTTAAQDPTTGANKDLTSDQAAAAIANSSTLNDLFSPTGAAALTYAWSTDGTHTGAGYKPDVNYNETSDNTKVRTAYVIITYGDSTTQSVQVHYNVHSLADRVDPSHTNDYNASHTVYDTHVNADILTPSAVNLTDADNFEDSNGIKFEDSQGHDITSSVTDWTFVGWKTKSGNTYNDATASDINVTDSDLTDGSKNANATDGKIYAELQMSDGSHAYIQMKNIKVYGGYTDSTSASFVPGTDLSTTTSQNAAKGDITNNSTLSTKFGNSSTPVKYEWKQQSGSGASLSYADIPTTDTTLTAGQISKTLAASDGYGILITYADGKTQFVKKDILITTSDGEANNDRLSGTIITVNEGHTLTNGRNNDPSAPSDAQRAVLVNGVSGSTSLPAGTGFAFVGTVDTRTPGDKAAIVRVTYPDNSATKPDTHDVHVIVRVLNLAQQYEPAGRDLTVNRNANVDRNDATPESANAVRAQDGISNTSAMPAGTTYSWSGANPDVSQAGSVVPAVIKVSFSDGSSDLVHINLHVNGTNPGSMASRFDPQGQDLRVHTGTNLNSITTIHDTDPAASGNKSFIANSSAMPIGTTYSWVTEPDTASVGTKTGVIKVTFADHSTKSLGVRVTVWNDASIGVAPTGQNIHITSGQALNASDGIANKTALTHVASSNGYTFTVTPSNINHTAASVTTPTAVIVHYADGSQSAAVPIFVTVDPVAAPGTTPTDAERYHARGTTIVRNMNPSASLTTDDAHDAVVVDASGISAVQSYAWVNDDFKNTALHSSGLKAGYVKITFNDNSAATVLAYVEVKSDSDRYASELSGKTTRVALNTPTSDSRLAAQNNVNVPSSVPASAIAGYAWVAAPSTATVGTFPESVRVTFADGSHADVQTTLIVYDNRTDAVRNHDALATNDITKYIGESITNTDAGNAIIDPARLIGSPTFSFVPAANNNIVDSSGKVKAPAGDKWGIINVHYTDGSNDTVAVIVHVKSYAEEENPEGKNLTVNQGANVNRSAGTPQSLDAINASDGIANKSSLSHVDSYTWASAPDVTTSGRTVNAAVRITYSDGSTTDVPILVTVQGSMHHTMADRYDPQGQNLRVHTGTNLDNITAVHDTDPAASGTKSFIANSSAMPSGTTYSWVTEPDTANVGTKSGVIKVTFSDSSSKTVGVTVTVWNDASISAVPAGQDIYKHVGDSINAREGIENAAALSHVSGYSFQGVTVPSTITAAAGIKPETVVVTYADGSINLVPIQVIVAENTTPTPGTPDHRTDAQRYSAVGKTITKDLGSGALNNADAQNAVTVQSGAPMAGANPFVWTSDNFKNTATNSTGLKSGFVTVTYRDGSQKQVRVYVNVVSTADRLRHAFSGKPETVNQGQAIPAPSNGYGVQTSATVPSGTTYAWQTTPSSAAPGSFPETVVISFRDGSHINVPTTLTVRDSRTDADFNVPTGHDLTVHVGDSLPAAATAVDNISSLTHYTSTTWLGSVDTTTAGDKPAVVEVHYADGSHNDLGIIVHVVDDASEYDPQGHDLTTNVNVVPNASDGINNKSSLPSGTTYSWVSNPDVAAAGTTVPGVIKVTYADHSSETVSINIRVNGTENHNDAFSFTPEGKNLTTTVGHEPNAADGISNKWNSTLSAHDNDHNHNLPRNVHFSWQTAPDVSTVGDKNAVIKVTYADHSSDEVAIIVHVTDEAHPDNPSGREVDPRGQNIETTVGHEPNAADGIANKSELSHVSGYHFASPVDVSTAGTKAATVVVGYADGSSRDVPIFVIVRNGSTPRPGSHEADNYHPVGQTIDRNMSQTADLNDTDAKDAIINSSSLPTNAQYTWTDPSFANNALRTSGLKSGQVTITYHDGSQDVVDVLVRVTSDADRYNPNPRPVGVNPSDPSHPTDPSDPTNRTPGVDPNTVPTGTTTSWPTDPSGNPIVPDTTVPGSHPTNIVVHYPDGSSRTVPTVVTVPDHRPDSERFNPSGHPFTIDPAHPSQPSDRTRPRDNNDPTNPMPGVDPSTVPSGTTTTWPTDPSGHPILPPTTPGDHNVHIVVHYPDGSTATIPTTVHVAAAPAPSEPSYVAPAPVEDHDLVFFDPENNDQTVKALPDEIVGEAGTDLPADSLRDLIATNIPDGYVLASSFRVSDMLMSTDTSAVRIPVLRRRLVFITKQGKKKVVLAAIFNVIHGKQWSTISKARMRALIKKYMPKGYKLADLYKVERTMITDHRDIKIPVQKKAEHHVRKTARHAKRHVAAHTKWR